MEVKILFQCMNCKNPIEEVVEVSDEAAISVNSLKDIFAGQEVSVVCKNCDESHAVYIYESKQTLDVHVSGVPEGMAQAAITIPSILNEWEYDASNSSSAFQYFISAINDISEFLRTNPHSGRARRAYHRMLFVQVISALETYFFDRFFQEVRQDPDKTLRLLSVDKDIGQEKVNVLSVAQDPRFIERKVERYLKGISYHNLPKVASLYKSVLGVSFSYQSDEDKEFLHKAISIRHHCVHRNGRDLEGEEVAGVDEDYVFSVISVVTGLITSLEQSLKEQRKKEIQDRLDDDVPF